MDILSALCGALLLILCVCAGAYAGRYSALKAMDAFRASAQTEQDGGRLTREQQLLNLLAYSGKPQEDDHAG